MKKKIYNNVIGLGYPPFNLNELKNILIKNPSIEGFHHIKNQIEVLENKYSIENHTLLESDISLKPISEKILSII
jgi:restriction endonuclease S subunit